MKVLIVDDSALLRERLRESLKNIKGLKIVGEATNGIDALNQVRDNNPDMVILDIRMPDMNGISVMENLRDQGNSCKICVFTNYPYQQYKQKCLNEGANYFFDKNEDFNELIDLMDSLAQETK